MVAPEIDFVMKPPPSPSMLTNEQKGILLNRTLGDRPDPESLERQGILKSGGKLAAQRAALELELTKNRIGNMIDSRPDFSDLVQQSIAVEQSLAPSLQATAKQLERSIIADKLTRSLDNRKNYEELDDVITDADIAPRLRSAKKQLEQAIARDKLNQKLKSRPDPSSLEDQNILLGSYQVAPSLHSVQRHLQRTMASDKVSQFLERRQADIEQKEADATEVAPSIQGAQRDLQRNLVKSQLYHALQQRPVRAALESRGILEHDPDVSSRFMQGSSQTQAMASYGSEPFLADPLGNDVTGHRKTRNFVLTRLLLKFVANLGESGEITWQQKGYLKDLIVDQDPTILAAAEVFESDGQLDEFKDTLLRLTQRAN